MVDVAVILVLTILLCFKEYQGRKERRELIQAVVARNATELANLQYSDKIKVEMQPENPNPDLTPVEQLNDEEFDTFILQHAT